MTEAPVLAIPNPFEMFVLDTDASDLAIGAELSQVQDGVERPMAYASKVLNTEQVEYCTTWKELLAVIAFTKQFRHYLLGRTFRTRTDHASLVWLLNLKNPGGQLARWLSELGQYFTIEHRKGSKHSNADGLSCIPQNMECDCYVVGLNLKSLPCGGCKTCERVRQEWEAFENEVDDVVPLAMRHRDHTAHTDEGKPSCGPSEGANEQYLESGEILAVVRQIVKSPAISRSDIIGAAPVSKAITVGEVQDTEGGSREEPEVEPGEREVPAEQEHPRNVGRQVQGLHSNFVEQLLPGEVREQQMNDPELYLVVCWLEGAHPSEAQLQVLSPNTRHLWLCRSQLEMVNGVSNYRWEDDNGVKKLLVAPQSMRQSILEEFHDHKTGRHLGRDKTLTKIRHRFYWYGMGRDVLIHVNTCAACSLNKRVQQHPRTHLQNYKAGCPGDRVHLDILGPFRESKRHNRYVLMIIDQFSRWLEIVPLPDQEAETIARAFFENFVVRFGVPFMAHTDQGRNFESDMFRSFCILMEITKTRTTPYRPSSNGQVERYNQLVLNFLRCYLAGRQELWDQYLPTLGMAIRATVNRSTGYTPNMLVLGHEINMPADILYGLVGEKTQFQSPSAWLQFLQDTLAQVHTEVRENIKSAQISSETELWYEGPPTTFWCGRFRVQTECCCSCWGEQEVCSPVCGDGSDFPIHIPCGGPETRADHAPWQAEVVWGPDCPSLG